MYHYNPETALEELTEDAALPNPVHMRDMMLRAHMDADHSLEMNRMFVEYQRHFGEAQKLAKELLQGLSR
jgi:phosphoserine phosphatase